MSLDADDPFRLTPKGQAGVVGVAIADRVPLP